MVGRLSLRLAVDESICPPNIILDNPRRPDPTTKDYMDVLTQKQGVNFTTTSLAEPRGIAEKIKGKHNFLCVKKKRQVSISPGAFESFYLHFESGKVTSAVMPHLMRGSGSLMRI